MSDEIGTRSALRVPKAVLAQMRAAGHLEQHPTNPRLWRLTPAGERHVVEVILPELPPELRIAILAQRHDSHSVGWQGWREWGEGEP